MRFLVGLLFFCGNLYSQVSSQYTISFENAVHHEAEVKAIFNNIESDTATFRMSRSSPGRYALHEFAKNVYNVKARDRSGNELQIHRTDPYSWHVANHNGSIYVSYTLFANHGDGTYAQIDETHAHLNIPATFMYMEGLENDEIEIEFIPRADLNWRIATQLKKLSDFKYYAKDLQFFMDSPTELSDHMLNSFTIGEGKTAQSIKIALHDSGATIEQFKDYTQHVEAIVGQQIAVYGELPKFDYGTYTFLACFMPQVSSDAMEHRNSTYLTSQRSLANSGVTENLGSAAHEFFHCWNVERIRPKSLEPFNFSEANMSGELWFAEGFTNYYTGLSMVRAGVRTHDQFLESLERTFNFVWGSPGRDFFNPIEMSYQAPFVDAARSVDETNRDNTFISYYSYGDMLGLALDLLLRQRNQNLDDYMKLVWKEYGKSFEPYNIKDLQDALELYTDKEFADNYFDNFIYKSKMPEFEALFNDVGINFTKTEQAGFGASIDTNGIRNNPRKKSTAYAAGLQKGDKIIRLNETTLTDHVEFLNFLKTAQIGDSMILLIERRGQLLKKNVVLLPDISYKIEFIEDDTMTEDQKAEKLSWLGAKN